MRKTPDSSHRARWARPLALLVAVLLVGVAAPSALAATATASASASASTAMGSSDLGLPADAVVLHVDDDATSWPDGSVSMPFPTISWAVAYGQMLRRHGYAVHVVVSPGVYREAVRVGWAGDDPAPLVIESEVPGEAVVSGADPATMWNPIGDTGIVASPWDEHWGLASIPGGWDGVTVPDGVRRREAVFVDGQSLGQVLQASELVPGSFLVDESQGQLVVDPPAGVTDLAAHRVEVARRNRALQIHGGARSVAVKGFTFEGTATALEHYMAYVSDGADILIENNTFRHSSWGGLGVCCTDGVTVRDNVAVDNGGNGFDTYRAQNALVEGNRIAENNTRGARFGYTGWSVAGSKHLLLHDALFRDNTYEHNYARGLWFDTDVVDVVVDGDRSCHNGRDGVFIEAVQGPLTIEHSISCNNDGAGVAVGTSGNVVLAHSSLVDNRSGQLEFTGERLRTWTDHVTGARVTMGDFANWLLVDNSFVSSGAAPLVSAPVIPFDDWDALLRGGEISASGDRWSRPSMVDAIQLAGSTTYPVSSWYRQTGD